jgi:hypothetical protein|tara:strand:- start:543 stop:1265 length:723 start_codon:yes stop_codon:yes gene_type:complete
MVTVVLNGYKRGQHLAQQLEAVKKQTLRPKEIMLWQNAGEDFDPQIAGKTTWASCNKNFGVWARFAYALNAKTEYICVFDDDTIPGKRWLENCYETIQKHEGLLGTIGVIYQTPNSYHPMDRVGWAAPNEKTERVDIVGHAWFFKREWLSTFWRELPEKDHPMIVGEDMHFSVMLQKYLGLNTYVPPHPKDNKELWGSLPDTAWSIGQDQAALSMNMDNVELMSQQLRKYTNNGFKIIKS